MAHDPLLPPAENQIEVLAVTTPLPKSEDESNTPAQVDVCPPVPAADVPRMNPDDLVIDHAESPFGQAAAPAELGAETASAAQLERMTIVLDQLVDVSSRYHARAEQREELIGRMHEELQVLRQGERRSVLRPLLTEVARVRDDLIRQAGQLPATFDVAAASRLLLSFADSLEIALADYGITSYRPQPGDQFESRTHRPVGRQETDQADAVGQVASVRRDGYLDLETGLPLSPSEVVVFVSISGPPGYPGFETPVPERMTREQEELSDE